MEIAGTTVENNSSASYDQILQSIKELKNDVC